MSLMRLVIWVWRKDLDGGVGGWVLGSRIDAVGVGVGVSGLKVESRRGGFWCCGDWISRVEGFGLGFEVAGLD